MRARALTNDRTLSAQLRPGETWSYAVRGERDAIIANMNNEKVRDARDEEKTMDKNMSALEGVNVAAIDLNDAHDIRGEY